MNKHSILFRTLFLDLKFPPHFGGTATMFRYRISQYKPENVTVFSTKNECAKSFDSNVSYTLIRKNIKHYGPKGFQWFFAALAIVFDVIRLPCKNIKYDFIEAARPFPEGVAAIILKLIKRKKCIINFHGEDVGVMSNYKVEKKTLFVMTFFADVILCNSSYTQSLIIKLFPKVKQKTYVVTPGFNPIKRESLDVKKIQNVRKSYDGDPVLITVGRICERKGQDKVIQALPMLVSKFPMLKYIIAGAIDCNSIEPERLLKIADHHNVKKHIKLVTNFSDEEKPYLLAASDIFIMPNRVLRTGEVEGYGIVFLEASHLGLPVIGGNSGGVIDAIVHRKTGLLVNGEKVEEIKDAIETLILDPKTRLKYGAEGYKFSSDQTYIKTYDRYFQICEAHCNK